MEDEFLMNMIIIYNEIYVFKHQATVVKHQVICKCNDNFSCVVLTAASCTNSVLNYLMYKCFKNDLKFLANISWQRMAPLIRDTNSVNRYDLDFKCKEYEWFILIWYQKSYIIVVPSFVKITLQCDLIPQNDKNDCKRVIFHLCNIINDYF